MACTRYRACSVSRTFPEQTRYRVCSSLRLCHVPMAALAPLRCSGSVCQQLSVRDATQSPKEKSFARACRWFSQMICDSVEAGNAANVGEQAMPVWMQWVVAIVSVWTLVMAYVIHHNVLLAIERLQQRG